MLTLIITISGAQAYFKEISLTDKQLNTVEGVRLIDIIKFHGNITPNLSELNKKILSNERKYFGKDAKTIHNLYLNSIPKRSGKTYELNLGAIVRTKSNAVKVYKLKVRYDSKTVKKPVVSSQKYTLGDANFKIEVSLADRKMVIYSRELDTKMVMPLGVGSFDENMLNPFGTSLLTPRFKVAWLEADRAIYSRKKPRYFGKKPFIRVSTPENLHTGIGFHIQPMPKKNDFIRAFDSHGCIRMQEDDLYMLYWLVFKNPSKKTPLIINFKIDTEAEHPFPKRNKPFKRVVNIGSKSNTQWKLDKDGLIWVANDWKKSAPVSDLIDDDKDHYHDLYNYKTTDFVDGYIKKCRSESYPSGKKLDKKASKRADKAFKKCMKRIQTKSSKLYKWWVHGK